MYAGQIKLILNALLGVVVVLSLMFAPVQASISVASNDMSGMTTIMKSTGCKKHPCPCEKTKIPCNMKFGCAVSCVGLSVTQLSNNPEHLALYSEISFVRVTETVASIETVPLRRPPRV